MFNIGTDIVFIPKIKKILTDSSFLNRVFHEDERTPFTAEHLAGIYAAKEAFFKALGKDPSWLSVHIKGKAPQCVLTPQLAQKIKHTSLSISHDKEYAIAQVLVEL